MKTISKFKNGLIFVLVFMLLCNSIFIGRNVYTVHADDTIDDGIATIIRNGDFEATTGDQALNIAINAGTGDIGSSDWKYNVSTATKVPMNFEVVAEVGRTGKAMKVYPDASVTSTTAGKGVVMQNEITTLEEGKKYLLTVYAKAVDTNDDSKIFLKMYNGLDSEGKSISFASDEKEASACRDWTEITMEFTANAPRTTGNKNRLEIHMYDMTAATGYWLLDDISITKIPSITVDKTEINLEVGESTEISASLDDPHKVLGESPELTWDSSDNNVATVDTTGKITAISAGTSTITVKVGNSVSAECAVTVSAKSETGDMTSIGIIRNGDFEETAGDQALNIAINAGTGDIGSSDWKYNVSTATKVPMNFEVVADAGRTGKAMKVYPDASVTSTTAGKGVVMQNEITTLEEGTRYLLTVYAKAVDTNDNSKIFLKMYNGVDSAGKSISFASDEKEANVYRDWTAITIEFTANAPRTTGNKNRLEIHMYDMTAATGYWLLDDISITKIPSITVDKTEINLEVGESTEISASLDDPHKVLGESPELTWDSSDDNIATVDVTGKVTAIGAGTATITVKAGNSVSAECTITVTAKGDIEDTTPTVIIKNGDFEATTGDQALNIAVNAGSGDVGSSNWRYNVSTATKVPMNFEIIADAGRSGNAVKIYADETADSDKKGKGVVFQNRITTLEEGERYLVTVYAKAVGTNDDSKINLIMYNGYDSTGGKASFSTSQVYASEFREWAPITKEFTANAPRTTTAADSLEIHLADIISGYWLLDDISIVKVPSITVDKPEVNLEVGGSTDIRVTIDDPHKALGDTPTLTWSSSNENIATVDAIGKVTAVGIGEATVIVKAGDNITAECAVTVTPKKVIFNGDFMLGLDGWKTGTGTDVAYTSVVEGSIDNALKIAASDGVTGAVSGNFEQQLDTKVTEGLVVNGSKYLVTVYAKPVGANRDSMVTASWFDSESATAQKAEIQAGTSTDWIPVTFEFTAGDMSATGTKLEVQVSNLTSGYWLFDDISIKRVPYVSLTPSEMNILVSERAEIDATMIDPDYILDKTSAFDYSSADESIAKVDLRGRVTGVSAGTTTITVTNAYYPEYSAACTVHVSAIDLTSISLPENLNLCEAEQQILTITFTPVDATNQAITWSSSDVGVVAVDENGLVTGMKAGTATITATGAGDLTATCTVTVRKSTTLLTEEAKITSTTYQEVVDSFEEFVTNNTGAEAVYSLYEEPANGVLTVNEGGSFSYIPRNGQVGDSETFTVIVNAGTEYAFLKGTIDLVETIDDNDSDSDSDSGTGSDTDSDSDTSDTDSDTDTDSDVQAPKIDKSATDDSYILGSNAEVTIKSTGDFAKFESVEMDGKIVDESNYTVKEGSTIVTFKAAYLETLSVGEHTVTINYNDGSSVDAKLTSLAKADTDTNTDSNDSVDNESDDADTEEVTGDIAGSTKEADATDTGDNTNMGLWLLLLTVAALGGAGCTLYKKNKGGK